MKKFCIWENGLKKIFSCLINSFRKTFQGGQPFPHTLSAVLLDNSDRQEIELCSTCRRKNEQILKIRSALIDDKGLIKVATSGRDIKDF
jgi:hypothetical protein